MHVRCNPVAACLLLAAPLSAISSDVGSGEPRGSLPFRTLGLDHGLLSRDIVVMVRDAGGVLWLGGSHGIYRWDGHHLVRFGTDEGLPSGMVQAVCLDGRKRLWVGTARGPAWFEGGRFHVPAKGTGLGASPVYGLATDHLGHLMISTAEGLYREHRPGYFELQKGWPGGRATVAWTDGEGRLWAGTDQGLLEISAGGDLRLHDASVGMGANRVDDIVGDGQGRLWVRSASGLWMLPKGGRSFLDLSAHLPGQTRRWGRLEVDRLGRVWVPGLEGILRVDGDRFEVLEGRITSAFRGVQCLLPGEAGDLWVGSEDGAHHLLGQGRWMNQGTSQGLPPGTVWCSLRDRQGRLWAGTSLGLYRGSAAGWQPIRGLGFMVRSLLEAPDGRLWLGGGPEAQVHVFDPATGHRERFGREVGLKGPRVLAMRLDREGTLWVGTLDGGLYCGQRQGGRMVWNHVRLPGSASMTFVTRLEEDAEGRLWAAGAFGLAVREGGRWRTFTGADGLPVREIQALQVLPGGEAWVGFMDESEVIRVRLQGDRLTEVQRIGLKVRGAQAPVFDLCADRGELWVGTGYGLWRLRASGELQHFGLEDGLIDPDITAHGLRMAPDGRLWVCTGGGISVLDTLKVDQVPMPGAPVLLAARLDGHDLLLGGPSAVGSALQVRAVLPMKGWDLEGRLEGPVALTQRMPVGGALFTGLAPGSYRLELRYRGPGQRLGPVTTLAFRIGRPWGIWAGWIAGLGGVGVGLLLLWRHHRRQVMLRGELDALVKAQAAALREAEHRLEAQDLRDPVTGLRNRRFFESMMPVEAARVLRLALRGEPRADLMFLFVEVDQLDRWEREHGTVLAEELMEQGARVLKDLLRGGDRIFRYDRNRFLVMVMGGQGDEAAQLAERIRRTFHQADLGAEGWRPGATCSQGYAGFPLPAEPADALGWEVAVAMAEAALELALLKGGDRILGAEPQPGLAPEAFLPMGPGTLDALVQEGKVSLR